MIEWCAARNSVKPAHDARLVRDEKNWDVESPEVGDAAAEGAWRRRAAGADASTSFAAAYVGVSNP